MSSPRLDTRPHVISRFSANTSFWGRLYSTALYIFGSLPLRRSRPVLVDADIATLKANAEPGDILLVCDKRRMGTFLIPGFVSHAIIVTSAKTVVHAVGQQVLESTFEDLQREYGLFVLMRDTTLSPDERERIARAAQYHIGEPYDFFFNPKDNSALFCSELVALTYKESDLQLCVNPARVFPDFIRPGQFLTAASFDIVLTSQNVTCDDTRACRVHLADAKAR